MTTTVTPPSATPTARRIPLATGLTYNVLEWNAASASDRTVVLLHGYLDFAYTWQAVVAHGLGDVHVIAPDMRGHGDSDRVGPGGYYYFPDYLADLASLIEATARPRVSLVGHSMGGMIAAYFTGSFPARVDRLALVEGTGPPEQEPLGPDRIANWIALWKKTRAASSARGYATVEEAAERLRKSDDLLPLGLSLDLARHGTQAGPDGRYRFKHDPLHLTPGPNGFQFDVAARFWSRVTCPVLIVDGAESLMRHSTEERARRHGLFVNRREVLLEGAAHMVPRHQPAALAALLRDFLELR